MLVKNSLDDFVRLQGTESSSIEFNLHGSVADLELAVQLTGDAMQKTVAGMTARSDEMARKGRFGRTHCPDMQIVDGGDFRQPFQEASHIFGIDPARRRTER